MDTLMYYGGNAVGIVFLVMAVFLWVFLNIRSVGRFLIKHNKNVPRWIKNSDKVLSIPKRKHKQKKTLAKEEPTEILEYSNTEILEDSNTLESKTEVLEDVIN